MNHDAERNEPEGGPIQVPEKDQSSAGEPAQSAGSPEAAKAVMDGYWAAMPEWMRQAFTSDTMIHEGVTRCAYAGYSFEKMLLLICDVLYTINVRFHAAALNAARQHGTAGNNNGNKVIVP